MYDRTTLVAAVRRVEADDVTALTTLITRRLQIAPNTAWRLVNGRTAPSAALAARIEAEYGVPTSALLRRTA